MSEPFIGEIRMFGGNFAPAGWAFCNGQLIPISENDTLFNLIGTTFGGDGQSTFALPNLQSRVPINIGTGGGGTYVLGQQGGVEMVTLTVNQMPGHAHTPAANTAGNGTNPTGSVWAGNTDAAQFAPPTQINGQMNAQAIQSVGGNLPHDNMIPYLAVSFIIALYGIYPTQS